MQSAEAIAVLHRLRSAGQGAVGSPAGTVHCNACSRVRQRTARIMAPRRDLILLLRASRVAAPSPMRPLQGPLCSCAGSRGRRTRLPNPRLSGSLQQPLDLRLVLVNRQRPQCRCYKYDPEVFTVAEPQRAGERRADGSKRDIARRHENTIKMLRMNSRDATRHQGNQHPAEVATPFPPLNRNQQV